MRQDITNTDHSPGGCCMSFADERELAEVRMIEEGGLRSAYDGGDTEGGVIKAFSSLRDFAVYLVHLDITAEHELDAKALIIAMGDIGREAAQKEWKKRQYPQLALLEKLLLRLCMRKGSLLH